MVYFKTFAGDHGPHHGLNIHFEIHNKAMHCLWVFRVASIILVR